MPPLTDQAKSMEQLRQQVVELRQEIAECRAALQERDLKYRTLLYDLPDPEGGATFCFTLPLDNGDHPHGV